MPRRKAVLVKSNERKFNGVDVAASKDGITVDGWYDSFVGLGAHLRLSWADLDALRVATGGPTLTRFTGAEATVADALRRARELERGGAGVGSS